MTPLIDVDIIVNIESLFGDGEPRDAVAELAYQLERVISEAEEHPRGFIALIGASLLIGLLFLVLMR